MRLTFLGSGDAFGSGGRFNTCFHLERAAHGNVLIDCGASSMVAIRKWQVDPNAISTVLVSHLHGDHFGGLPFFLLDAQLVSRRTAPLILAGPPGFRERLMTVMEAMFAGSTKVERKFTLEIRELDTARAGGAERPRGHALPDEALQRRAVLCAEHRDRGQGADLFRRHRMGRGADPGRPRRRPLHLRGLFLRQGDEVPHRLHDLARRLPEIGAKRTIVTHMSAELLGRQGEIALEAAHDGLVVEF